MSSRVSVVFGATLVALGVGTPVVGHARGLQPPSDPDDGPGPLPQPTDDPEPAPDPPPEPDPPRDPQPDPPGPMPVPPGGAGTRVPNPLPEAQREGKPEDSSGTGRLSAAPFGELTTGTAATDIEIGGDLVVKPHCKDDGYACNGGRLGVRARFPVATGSTTGTGRASADALQGFAKSWRLGLVLDYVRDTTGTEGPAKFFTVTAAGEWGVQSFIYHPQADVADTELIETKHSADFLLRLLAYRHHPASHRIAPQLIFRYRRDWEAATPVGIVQTAGEGLPDITRDLTIDRPLAKPVFAVTVPILYSIQKGKRVLPQLGFGPALSYAAAGDPRGYNPFTAEHLVRIEHWLYWYPTGSEGLEGPKTNVRIGAAPFLDIRVRGRSTSETTTNVGALLEIKVGVRGYEY